MDLKTANLELEKLENQYEYWLNEKETILTIVMPQSPDPTKEPIEGGTRVDKFAKYAELDDEKKINDTLDFIHKRKQNLLKWLTNELKILNKYGEVEALIIQYKEKGIYNEKEGRFIDMTWEQIAKEVHYSKTFCRNVYRTYKNQRFID